MPVFNLYSFCMHTVTNACLNKYHLMCMVLYLVCPTPTPTDGLSLLNEDGDLRVFFPRHSFVTNTTLTRTNSPREPEGSQVDPAVGNDHIVCNGGDPLAAQISWYNNKGMKLGTCAGRLTSSGPIENLPCQDCTKRCRDNGGVGVDPPLNGHTDIHMYTDSIAYVNQDLECRVSSGQSAFIGVYLINGGECGSHDNDIQ